MNECNHIEINRITGLCLKCGFNTYGLTMREYKKKCKELNKVINKKVLK